MDYNVILWTPFLVNAASNNGGIFVKYMKINNRFFISPQECKIQMTVDGFSYATVKLFAGQVNVFPIKSQNMRFSYKMTTIKCTGVDDGQGEKANKIFTA